MKNLSLIPAALIVLVGSAHAATTVTGVTYANGASFGATATVNTDYILNSVTAGGTTYGTLEGGVASAANSQFQITTYNNATSVDAIGSATGLNLARGNANGNATFSFTQNLNLYTGFAVFEYRSGTSDASWAIEAIDSVGATVGSFNAGGASFGGVALKGPTGGWYRNSGAGGQIGGSSDGPGGAFFNIADFTETTTGSMAGAVGLKITGASGNTGPDPFAMVALNVPEPSALLLSTLGFFFLLRRKR